MPERFKLELGRLCKKGIHVITKKNLRLNANKTQSCRDCISERKKSYLAIRKVKEKLDKKDSIWKLAKKIRKGV